MTLHVPLGKPVRLTMTSRGRDPQLLRSGFPGQAGRAARTLHPVVVHRDAARRISTLLRRILRRWTTRRWAAASWSCARRIIARWLNGHPGEQSLAARRGGAVPHAMAAAAVTAPNPSVHAPALVDLYGRPVQSVRRQHGHRR